MQTESQLSILDNHYTYQFILLGTNYVFMCEFKIHNWLGNKQNKLSRDSMM